MNPRIPIDPDRLSEFCRRHHVRKLSLFGSVLRDDFRPDSDVDVLYELEPGHEVGYFTLFDMESELSQILGGREVEMVDARYVNRWIRDAVFREAEVQYGQG